MSAPSGKPHDPAVFSVQGSVHPGGVGVYSVPFRSEITLRDLFAVNALNAIVPKAADIDAMYSNGGIASRAYDLAALAYRLADAMLAQRERSK